MDLENIILASSSPRRRNLMSTNEIVCRIVPSNAEEIHDASLPPGELTETNARLKAEEVAARFPEAVVIGADTLIFIDGEPLGKPSGVVEAMNMLKRLSGRTHQVSTGVCIMQKESGKCVVFHDFTDVIFKRLTYEDIGKYMEKVDTSDKAGAYAAQEHGDMIIEDMKGSWSNVVGLPMEKLAEELDRF